MQKTHVVVIGAGAVGGYVGGHLARAGEDVTIVDPWPEHIEQIRKNGLHLSGTQGDCTVRVNALNVCDVQKLIAKPVDIAIICTKAFDTAWAVTLVKQYLSASGYVVSMQNGINEDCVAAVVGWNKTVGCVLNTIGVGVVEPGHVTRYRMPGDAKHAVFLAGEAHGMATDRAKDLVRRLEAVDSATVTTNLWGERWTKLVTNAMQMGILGATGLTKQEVNEWDPSRNLMVRAAAEGISVGRALGYEIGPIVKVSPEHWVSAASGDGKCMRIVEAGLSAYLNQLTEAGRRERDSMGRDVMAGRRTEVDFINGLIAARGEQTGVPVPVHRGLTSIIRRIERREIAPHGDNILPLC
ncbi:MAG: 2-dehydropantoate 2-reductase [Betaproteobacteria bacterium]|nr:2-dehydropantoate 2-reductase [Betaproteobacteria bacterium]MBI2288804.1 2-dehydropantoate 2-reductase [Betaproteobacteria bacterium]MBI3056979.1 2-dehydropantoate 2-reductase [Betaproteobacteria bacterium]